MPLDLFPSLLGNPAQAGRIIELFGPVGLGKTTVVRNLFNQYGGAAAWVDHDGTNATLDRGITLVTNGMKLVVVDGWTALPQTIGITLDQRCRMQFFKRLFMSAFTRDAVVLFVTDTHPRTDGWAMDGVAAQNGDNFLKYYASDRLQFVHSNLGARVTLVKTKTPPMQGSRLFTDTTVVWKEASDVQAL